MLIKKYLSDSFLKEEKTPAISLNTKIQKDNGKINKKGVKDIEKDSLKYNDSLKQDKETSKMSPNKFNYSDDFEETYHDEMEIMNGQEMIQYDRIPNKEFKDRALEAIEGSTRMGNNPEWANVVPKQQGFEGPEFGKNLVKKIKASVKKRNEQTPTLNLRGQNIQADLDDDGNKPYAIQENNIKEMAKPAPQISEKNRMVLTKWVESFGAKESAVKLINALSATGLVSDLPDSNEYGSGLNRITTLLEKKDFDRAFQSAKTLASKLEKKAMRNMYENIHNTAQMGGILSSPKYSEPTFDFRKELQPDGTYNIFNNETGELIKTGLPNEGEANYFMNNLTRMKKTNNDITSNTKIKESMKRLKFKNEFKGLGNALKLIPEAYKVDNKEFEMTDGNESYKIRWEGTLTEGKAIVLSAADKNLINEDLVKMKHLFGYKPQQTLGSVTGNARLNENKVFTDMLSKMKALNESEDIENADAKEGNWEEEQKSAPEATKHVEKGSATYSSKPKEGNWDEVSGGEKMMEIDAPTPKEGNWDEISVPQASEAKKHVHLKEDEEIELRKKINEDLAKLAEAPISEEEDEEDEEDVEIKSDSWEQNDDESDSSEEEPNDSDLNSPTPSDDIDSDDEAPMSNPVKKPSVGAQLLFSPSKGIYWIKGAGLPSNGMEVPSQYLSIASDKSRKSSERASMILSKMEEDEMNGVEA